jgi:hypothetical protein
MKKLIALMAGVIAVTCAIPATAGADRLPMGPFRDYVADKAFNDYQSTPESTGWYIDRCTRRGRGHVLRCDANVYGTHSFCEGGACYTQEFICWRTITRVLSPHWQRYRVRNFSSRYRCVAGDPVPVP